MSREAFYTICGALIGMLIVYVLAAYIALEWNPLAFDEGDRVLFALFMFIFAWAGAVVGHMIGSRLD